MKTLRDPPCPALALISLAPQAKPWVQILPTQFTSRAPDNNFQLAFFQNLVNGQPHTPAKKGLHTYTSPIGGGSSQSQTAFIFSRVRDWSCCLQNPEKNTLTHSLTFFFIFMPKSDFYSEQLKMDKTSAEAENHERSRASLCQQNWQTLHGRHNQTCPRPRNSSAAQKQRNTVEEAEKIEPLHTQFGPKRKKSFISNPKHVTRKKR